ncbi:MAG: asparagine synthase (glutamine-hydrolyzing) [Pseudoxanthomonas sp.]|nr:asparagine synthase (glutamine-hydrolyzing) [Pseudoxanthomonas sp.]
MCGIAGFVGAGDVALLRHMTDSIAYRGPDAEGFLAESESGVFLGHRRLSILDATGGAQPMVTADGSHAIVFNGEIYNFGELRRALEAEGVRFSSDHSDTEVLLLGYRQWGEALLPRLNGMWAFAIHDRVRNRLFLSRDRFGKKPLYYAATPGAFAFASELGALRRHPATSGELDPLSLRKYYAYGYVPAPRTLYRNVWKLPAGHSLSLDLATLQAKPHCYWSWQAEPVDPVPAGAEDLWVEELLALLDAAVARRLVADVPVGSFLSGGIDSSLVSALAARHVGAERLKSFSIGFEEAGFDESRHAIDVARLIGSEHALEVLSVERALEALPELLPRLDEPVADSSILPTYLLCRHARRHVTVAIGGDGADELFAGYDPFKALAYAGWYGRLVPRPVHAGVAMAISGLPVSHSYMSLDFRLKRMLRGLDHPRSMHLPAWMGPLSPRELGELSGEPIDAGELYSEAVDAWEGCRSADPVDRATAFFVRLYLQDDILPKIDRSSMLNSLEVRSPFLDIEVADFARRLPARFRLRGGTTKWLLKRAAERILPARIVHRRKQGFAMPVGRWFATGQLDLGLQGAPDAAFWTRLADEHRRGRADHRLALWARMMLGQVPGLTVQTKDMEPA